MIITQEYLDSLPVGTPIFHRKNTMYDGYLYVVSKNPNRYLWLTEYPQNGDTVFRGWESRLYLFNNVLCKDYYNTFIPYSTVNEEDLWE